MASFKHNQSLAQFQAFVNEVYSIPDDQHYSIWDLLEHVQRYGMRALKGIRKNNPAKIRLNLVISFSFLMAIANRLHIDLEEEVWQRFPMLCSYCGKKPCECKIIKPLARQRVRINSALRPGSLSGFQHMFNAIYPADGRTLTDAGIHLAEEIGEITEAIQIFLNQHQKKQFEEVKLEMADCVSCMFGVANSLPFECARELSVQFSNNCHVCHKSPCGCNFKASSRLRT